MALWTCWKLKINSVFVGYFSLHKLQLIALCIINPVLIRKIYLYQIFLSTFPQLQKTKKISRPIFKIFSQHHIQARILLALRMIGSPSSQSVKENFSQICQSTFIASIFEYDGDKKNGKLFTNHVIFSNQITETVYLWEKFEEIYKFI